MASAAAHPIIATGVALGAAGAAIATPISVHNANVQRQQQQQMYQRQADIAKQNAELARQQAEAKALQQRRAGIATMGTQLNNMAGSGIDIIESNFLDVVGESAANQEFDVLNTKYQGQLAARQHNLSAEESMMSINSLDSQMQNPLLEGTIATTKYLGGQALNAYNKGYINTSSSSIDIRNKMSYSGDFNAGLA